MNKKFVIALEFRQAVYLPVVLRSNLTLFQMFLCWDRGEFDLTATKTLLLL